MLAFSALVAGSFSLGAMAAPHVSPSALTVLRFALACAVAGGFVWMRGGVTRAAFDAPWRHLVLGGLYAAYFVLMFEGLRTASAVSESAVFTLTPIMAAGLGWLILRQVTTPRMAVALACGATGALWVIFRADLSALLGFHIGRGEAIYFWGCVAHAFYAPLVRLFNRGEPPAVLSLGVMISGLVLVSLWGWRDVVETDWAALPRIVWICLVYVAVAATAITTILLQYAAIRLPAAKVMAYTYLVPSWVILWELALGHTAPPVLVLGGVALTVVALLLLLKDEHK
jgi:drug/metabolite transporter (DMT)-like permease